MSGLFYENPGLKNSNITPKPNIPKVVSFVIQSVYTLEIFLEIFLVLLLKSLYFGIAAVFVKHIPRLRKLLINLRYMLN